MVLSEEEEKLKTGGLRQWLIDKLYTQINFQDIKDTARDIHS